MNNIDNKIYPKQWELQDYVDLIVRRRWIIFVAFVLIFGGVVIYQLFKPPVYESAATFMLEQQKLSLTDIESNLSQTVRPFGYYEALINSAEYVKRVVVAAKQDSILSIYIASNKISIEEMHRNNFKLTNSENNDLFYLTIHAENPLIAYRLAEIVTYTLKTRSQEIETEGATNIVKFVKNQIDIASAGLESSEQKLQEFIETTKFTLSEGNGGMMKHISDLESQLTEVETQRELTQANLQTYKARLKQFENSDSTSLWSVESPEVKMLRQDLDKLEQEKSTLSESGSASLQTLRQLDQKIEAKKNDLVQAIVYVSKASSQSLSGGTASLRNMIHEQSANEEVNLYILKNREAFYRQLIENYRRRDPNLLGHSIELARLQRAKTVYENLYNFLVERAEEAKINAASSTGGIRIVDLPTVAAKPMPRKMVKGILIGFIIGMGLGFALALIRDYFDNSIRQPEEVERFFEMPVMGSVPQIKETNGKHHPGAVDTYRNLRTNLHFVSVDNPINKLLVTSAIPGEGKTVTTANLAISFAELGKKTLIVDGDLRKPMQHKLFKVEKSPGLTDALAKNLAIDQIIHALPIHNTYLLTAGSSSPNPAKLIASDKMTDLIDELTQLFDLIVFDSPPLIAVTDPVLLAAKIGAVLLVIKFASTNKRLISNALSRFENVQTNVLGAVLNGIHYPRVLGYYKNNYYYYQYYYDYSGNGERKRKKKKEVTIVGQRD